MIRYDYSQPYITRDEYLEVKGVDLDIELQADDNQSNKVNRFIQDITNFVLDHLVMEYNCNELNRQTNQFEDLAEFRRVRFHYGMLEQIEYVLNNGLIQLDSGINRETGAITDFSGLVIGSSALKQFRLGGFCNKQEGTGHRGDLSPKDMPTVEELVLELGKKVDKVDGKGLSTNDYTTADKLTLKQVAQDLNDKLDKEEGKTLSSNDFSDAYKEKLDGIESGAQQNVIEEIKLENQPISVAGKSVNIDVSYKEDKSNKSTIISSASTDIQYASARAVHNAVESAKASAEDYADSKVTRANLVQVLGEASQYLNGLMSAQDKERLDVLYALLGDSEDADTVVDTINEVLAIFNQYPEGADLVNALAGKVEYDDIINTVDSNETRKPLSAAMGKYLKGLIDALTLVVNAKANSNDVYTKTEIDAMVDGFVFADIDSELDPESENAVQNKVVTEELEKKANKDGNYPTMTVGQAEAIASNREIDDAEIACPPITFGIAGDEAEIQTGINKLEYLEGKSIVFNQMLKKLGGWSGNGCNQTYDADKPHVTMTATSSSPANFSSSTQANWTDIPNSYGLAFNGHKVLVRYTLNASSSHFKSVCLQSNLGDDNYNNRIDLPQGKSVYAAIKSNVNANYPILLVSVSSYSPSEIQENETLEYTVEIFDLTAMGLESISTPEEFFKMFPLDYYEYNAGSIISSKAASLISRGKNQFTELNSFIRVVGGETYEISGISAGGVLTEYDINKNLIKTSDTFTDTVDIELDEATAYVKIAATTYEDIMFYNTFAEDGGVYNEPYIAPRVETVELPNIELRSVGDVKDIAYASGGGKRRIGIVDLGTLRWYPRNSDDRYGCAYAYPTNIKYPSANTVIPKILCDKYQVMTFQSLFYDNGSSTSVSGITLSIGNLEIKNPAFRNYTYEQIAAALSGVYLIYELATETDIPTSENAGWTPEVFVDNFGTLEFTTSPAQVPQVEQPYFIRYTVSLVEFLDTGYVKCKGDGNNIATQEEVDEMKAGNVEVGLARVAENLTPYSENSGAEDDSSFTMQTAGGEADIGSIAQMKALRGNTVKWNQIAVLRASGTPYGVTITNNNDGSLTISGTGNEHGFPTLINSDLPTIANHYYLIKGASASLPIFFAGSVYTTDFIHKVTTTANRNVQTEIISETTYNETKWLQIFDLTEIFGAGNEPTTVAEFNRMFPKSYYQYNVGTLLSCKSNGYKTVGYNAFDGETEHGSINLDTGEDMYVVIIKRVPMNKAIKVIAGQTYTLSIDTRQVYMFIYEYDENKNFIKSSTLANNVPYSSSDIVLNDNTHFVRFACSNEAANIAFHLTWDGSRTGYEPYESKTYPLPNVELRSAGSAYDELKPDGTLIRRVGSYTFTGNETWNAGTGGYGWALYNFVQNNGAKPQTSNNIVPALVFSIYQTTKPDDITGQNVNKAISYNVSGSLLVRDTSITSASAMASAMADKTIYFELAEPTEEQTGNTFQEVADIDDFGTQEFLSEQEIQVPQGAEFFYPADYKAFIDSLGGREDVQYDAGELVSHTELQSALASFLSSISGYDATKTQTLKNNQGTFVWEDDEQ